MSSLGSGLSLGFLSKLFPGGTAAAGSELSLKEGNSALLGDSEDPGAGGGGGGGGGGVDPASSELAARSSEGLSVLLGDDFVPSPTGPAEASGGGGVDLSDSFGGDEDTDDVLPAVSRVSLLLPQFCSMVFLL